jgi:hypothetical protein
MGHTHDTHHSPNTPAVLPGRTLLITVGLLVGSVVVQAIVSIGLLVGYLALGGSTAAGWAIVALSVPAQLVMFGFGYLFVTRRLDGVRTRVPSRGDLGLIAAGSVLILGVIFGGEAVLAATGLAAPPDAMLEAAAVEPLILVAFAVLSLVLIGPAEELFFRGAVQGNLRTAFGPVVAIGLTGLLFGLVHVTGFLSAGVALSVPVLGALSLNVLSGLVFGALYERTGNLTVPVVVHGLTNAVGLLYVFTTL